MSKEAVYATPASKQSPLPSGQGAKSKAELQTVQTENLVQKEYLGTLADVKKKAPDARFLIAKELAARSQLEPREDERRVEILHRRNLLEYLNKTMSFKHATDLDGLDELKEGYGIHATRTSVLEPSEAFDLLALQEFMQDHSGKRAWSLEEVFAKLRNHHTLAAGAVHYRDKLQTSLESSKQTNAGLEKTIAAQKETISRRDTSLLILQEDIRNLNTKASLTVTRDFHDNELLRGEQLRTEAVEACRKELEAKHQADIFALKELHSTELSKARISHDDALRVEKDAHSETKTSLATSKQNIMTLEQEKLKLDTELVSAKDMSNLGRDTAVQSLIKQMELYSTQANAAINEAKEYIELKAKAEVSSHHLEQLLSNKEAAIAESTRKRDELEGNLHEAERAKEDLRVQVAQLGNVQMQLDKLQLDDIPRLEHEATGLRKENTELKESLSQEQFQLQQTRNAKLEVANDLASLRASHETKRVECENLTLDVDARIAKESEFTEQLAVLRGDIKKTEKKHRGQLKSAIGVAWHCAQTLPNLTATDEMSAVMKTIIQTTQMAMPTDSGSTFNLHNNHVTRWHISMYTRDELDQYPADVNMCSRLWLHACCEKTFDPILRQIERTIQDLPDRSTLQEDWKPKLLATAQTIIQHRVPNDSHSDEHTNEWALAALRSMELITRAGIAVNLDVLQKMWKMVNERLQSLETSQREPGLQGMLLWLEATLFHPTKNLSLPEVMWKFLAPESDEYGWLFTLSNGDESLQGQSMVRAMFAGREYTWVVDFHSQVNYISRHSRSRISYEFNAEPPYLEAFRFEEERCAPNLEGQRYVLPPFFTKHSDAVDAWIMEYNAGDMRAIRQDVEARQASRRQIASLPPTDSNEQATSSSPAVSDSEREAAPSRPPLIQRTASGLYVFSHQLPPTGNLTGNEGSQAD